MSSTQQRYSSHSKQEGSPRQQKEKENEKQPKEKILPEDTHSSANFSLSAGCHADSLGYACSQLESVVLADTEVLMACSPWLTWGSGPAKPGHHFTQIFNLSNQCQQHMTGQNRIWCLSLRKRKNVLW